MSMYCTFWPWFVDVSKTSCIQPWKLHPYVLMRSSKRLENVRKARVEDDTFVSSHVFITYRKRLKNV